MSRHFADRVKCPLWHSDWRTLHCVLLGVHAYRKHVMRTAADHPLSSLHGTASREADGALLSFRGPLTLSRR